MNRTAGCYRTPKFLLLHAEARTTAGVQVASEPVWLIDVEAGDIEIGQALQAALNAFVDGVPHPDRNEWRDHSARFLKAAGFRSWRSLENKARSCWIRDGSGKVVITPLRNGGRTGDSKGFQPFGVPKIEVAKPVSAGDLGQALRTALDRAE